MDDLNAIRQFEKMSWRLYVVMLVGHALFGIGMVSNLVNRTFRLTAWIVVAGLFFLIARNDLTVRCPRCAEPFRYQLVFGFRVPASVRDSCVQCGLRALKQSDIRRYQQELRERKDSVGQIDEDDFTDEI